MIKTDKETEQKIEQSLDKALRHPHWKKEYENAPSEECRDYLRFTYYSSDHFDPDSPDAEQFDALQAQVESRLNVKDWEYLKSMAPNSPFIGYCDKMIRKLSK